MNHSYRHFVMHWNVMSKYFINIIVRLNTYNPLSHKFNYPMFPVRSKEQLLAKILQDKFWKD